MSRQTVTVRQVSELTGFLLHVSYALRPGKFFVGQLPTSVGMAQSAAFPSDLDNPNRRVTLGPLFYDEVEFRLWFVAKGLTHRGGHFSSPMYLSLIHI